MMFYDSIFNSKGQAFKVPAKNGKGSLAAVARGREEHQPFNRPFGQLHRRLVNSPGALVVCHAAFVPFYVHKGRVDLFGGTKAGRKGFPLVKGQVHGLKV
jgi:hypothetical protein